MKNILLIPQIEIQNANALSSPYTIGFPAMTAWLGSVHALQRKLNQKGFDSLRFEGTAVVSHSMDLKTFRGPEDYNHSIVGTGNPLDKNGKRPSFIVEARCSLNVSLIIEYEGILLPEQEEFLKQISTILNGGLKMAAGDILSSKKPEILKIDNDKDLKKLMRKVMPGYLVVSRRELVEKTMQEEGKDAMDAVLDYLKIYHKSENNEEIGEIHWKKTKKESGWLIPVAVGYQGLTPIGKIKNQRDPEVPHRFVESMVTLGEFIMPYRAENIEQILWNYRYEAENEMYLCENNYKKS